MDKKILEENLVFKWKIYDLDFFNVYENEYILWITHFYSPENIKTDFLKNIFFTKTYKKRFWLYKRNSNFWTRKTKILFWSRSKCSYVIFYKWWEKIYKKYFF